MDRQRWVCRSAGAMMLLCVSASPALWAACPADTQSMATPTFIGTVCRDATGEAQAGRWIIEMGGVFEGSVTVTADDTAGHYTLIKDGTLNTPRYVGTLFRYESSLDDGAGGSLTSDYEQFYGTEIVPDGGTFEGTITTQTFANGFHSQQKEGMVQIPSFNGVFLHCEGECYDARTGFSWETPSYERTYGTEKSPTGGVMAVGTSLSINAPQTVTFEDGSGLVIEDQFVNRGADFISPAFNGEYWRFHIETRYTVLGTSDQIAAGLGLPPTETTDTVTLGWRDTDQPVGQQCGWFNRWYISPGKYLICRWQTYAFPGSGEWTVFDDRERDTFF